MRKLLVIALSIVLVGTVAAACGGGGKKTVTIPGTNEKVSVSGKLPSGFPGDFPVYKGANLLGSVSGTQEGISGDIVTWETGDSVEKVKAFYDDAFASGSWTSDSNGTMGDGAFWSAENKDGTKVAWVSVVRSDNKTNIVAAVGDKEATAGGEAKATATTKPSAAKTTTSGGTSKSPTPEPESNAELPKAVSLSKDFPADKVPFPSGALVTSDSTYGSGGQKSFIVEIYVKQPPDKVADYFKGELPKHGWTSTVTSSENNSYFLMFSGENENTSVTITAEESDVPGYTKAGLLLSVPAQ